MSNLIAKIKTGKKLEYESMVKALLASLRHKNYHLAEIVDVLLNDEEFHTTHKNELIRQIYDYDEKFRLF